MRENWKNCQFLLPFWVLTVPQDIDQDKVYAEIRGLGLLKDIINSSSNWFHEIDYDMEPLCAQMMANHNKDQYIHIGKKQIG